MEIKPGSYSYDMWVDLPIPMYMKVYYFNPPYCILYH
jgi:CD36 family